ncbi:MAG: hypothetical protein O3A63_08695 [Proteobacteria bacterium]|nr:hypothetical protein [Pseudomonadota bacterium]
MNWEAISAIGEIIGAAAVTLTLIILVFQIRHSTRTMAESNRLERASALDRHSDTISRWRGRLMENEDLARIWLAGRRDEELSEVERIRLNNLWIDFANLQRANFVRANTVGEAGLAIQAATSIAAEKNQSETFAREWNQGRPWHELASPEFVSKVEEESDKMQNRPDNPYTVGGQ